MAEWTDQIAEMQQKWVDQQRKLMTEWLESMKSGAVGMQPPDWRQAADLMEQQVTSALDTQQRSLQAMIGNMRNMEGAPKELAQAAKQMEEGVERWTGVQNQMWKVWFDTLRDASSSAKSPGESMKQNWEDAIKRTMSIQEQWLSGLAASPGKGGENPSSKPGKPAAGKKTGKKTKKRT